MADVGTETATLRLQSACRRVAALYEAAYANDRIREVAVHCGNPSTQSERRGELALEAVRQYLRAEE